MDGACVLLFWDKQGEEVSRWAGVPCGKTNPGSGLFLSGHSTPEGQNFGVPRENR